MPIYLELLAATFLFPSLSGAVGSGCGSSNDCPVENVEIHKFVEFNQQVLEDFAIAPSLLKMENFYLELRCSKSTPASEEFSSGDLNGSTIETFLQNHDNKIQAGCKKGEMMDLVLVPEYSLNGNSVAISAESLKISSINLSGAGLKQALKVVNAKNQILAGFTTKLPMEFLFEGTWHKASSIIYYRHKSEFVYKGKVQNKIDIEQCFARTKIDIKLNNAWGFAMDALLGDEKAIADKLLPLSSCAAVI